MVASFFFFFNDTATTEIYTLSLHDALPIFLRALLEEAAGLVTYCAVRDPAAIGQLWPHAVGDRVALSVGGTDRKSTRLNSSHLVISYAVFCLKKKKYCNYHLRCVSRRPSVS